MNALKKTAHTPADGARPDRDIIIVGGGHNGLVCAAYLAKAGLKVTVLERRDTVGGAAVTEEFHPGFRNSVASYTVSLLNPKVIADLDLHGHGLEIVERRIGNFLPLEDDRYLLAGDALTREHLAKFSPRDAERLGDYEARLEVVADTLRALVLETPPNLSEGSFLGAIPDLLKAANLGGKLGNMSMTARRDLLDLFSKSAGDWLDGWFESDAIKALFGFDSIVGNFASPYTPGSAYVLLHHLFGEVNGKKGAWGHAIGGMGAITQAMARCCEARGVEIRTGCAVDNVLVDDAGRSGAVRLASGETLSARAVVSNLNPKLLFGSLIDPAALPDDFSERIRHYRCGSGTFRMNVALDRLPSFTALPGEGDHLTAGIIMAPSLAYMEQAYVDARRDGWSKAPIIEMLIPSTLDPTLAPDGQHVASLFCQHVSPELPGGRDWDDHRDEVARVMLDTVEHWAPGFKDSVLGYQALTPKDLERTFGLVGGDIFHGALSLDQLFSARPVLGHADHRSPIKGLYQCGSGTHPGGGVTGAPGHNAAREILKDFGKRMG
jgi:phytoene dehydrogenase-like protein